MLEIAIIICLAVILFLVLKNYPKVSLEMSEASEVDMQPKIIGGNVFANFFKKRRKNFDDIEEEIKKGQESVMAPIAINNAKKAYGSDDPEIAKLLLESDQAFMENDLRTAEDLAIEVLIKDKKNSQSYITIGKIAFARGEFEDAKESFKTALKCDKEAGEAYFGLGLIEMRGDNLFEAIEFLQKAVSQDRGMAEWYAELGKAYMHVRQFAKAAKALKRASSLNMDNKEYKILASTAEDKQRMHTKAYLGKK